ncbi:MAG TPA: WYL domain-containing protein [Kiritimatiellia bacterium]|nr:WYL domain-containing protein [Kiritimatiellia bacterium]HMP00676.1 WYL domain-containing protein [Kiritimatiellia bacterium]HMP97897.1 WYL domain-containing protein [Kiritimatiellia bacterium]
MEIIRHGQARGNFPSARIFAEALEVSWHTIIRDLDYLRDDEGAPIVYDASRKGFYLSDASWQLPPVTLNQREVFAFSIAARMIQPFEGTPLEMDLKSLFGKISRSLQDRVTLSADALTEHLSILREDYVPVDRDRWLRVAELIERGEAIRMRYQNFRGEEREHVVRPVHLAAYHGNWYVLAIKKDAPRPATYALSRIRRLRKAKHTIPLPANFRPADALVDAFGIAAGDEERRVHLRFSPAVAVYIAERVWHPSQRILKRRDGSVDLIMTTRGWKELVRWILSWQPDVRVLAPASLKSRIREKLMAAMEADDRRAR